MLGCGAIFWPVIEIQGPMHHDFEKKYSRNIVYHKEDTVEIIFSPTLGLYDHEFGFYKELSNGALGSGATFWPVIEFRGPLHHDFGKKYGNIFDHKKDTLVIFKPNFRSVGP